jgi:timeless
LRDLVETTHVFLKLMEHMSKSKHIMVSKKSKRKKKSGAKAKKSGADASKATIFMSGSREANEAKWDNISSDLSRILQGQVPNQVLEQIRQSLQQRLTFNIRVTSDTNLSVLV